MGLNLDGLIGLIGQVLDVPGDRGARVVGALSSVTYYDETPEVELNVAGVSLVLMPGDSVRVDDARRVYTLA